MNGDNETRKQTGTPPENNEKLAKDAAAENLEETDGKQTLKLKTIGVSAVALFCRQLSTLVDVGIPLLKCLQILYQRTSHPKLQKIIQQVSQEIEQGTAFSTALEKFPKVFSAFFINMVKVAEKGGGLEESLRVVADVMEKEEIVRQKVRDALYYPLITLIVGFFVVAILVLTVIPIFGDLYARQDLNFQEFNFEIPWPTQVLLALSDPNMFWILLLLVGLILFLIYGKSHGSREFYDRNKMKIPIFGPLFVRLYVARFARNFGTLIRGGVPMLQALDVVKGTSENVVVAEAVQQVIQHVERGGRLEQPLREADIFPDVVVDMVAIGEESGKLDLMLFKIADLYDGEIDRTINTLASSLQPILIVVLGLLTAFVAAAMFWPYFNMAEVFGSAF